MGFWDELKDGLKAAGGKLMVRQKVEELIEMSPPVARREMRHALEDLDDESIRYYIETLDSLAREESGKMADQAAEFAEYAESFLDNRR